MIRNSKRDKLTESPLLKVMTVEQFEESYGLTTRIDFQSSSFYITSNTAEDGQIIGDKLPPPIQRWKGLTKESLGRHLSLTFPRYVQSQESFL